MLKSACAALCAATLIGCSEGDGTAELAEGREAYARHDLKSADRAFSASLSANGTNVDALVEAALVKVDLGRIAEARRVLRTALDKEPESSDVLLLDAEIAYHAKEYDAAILDYRKIAENKSYPDAIRSQAYAGIGVVQYTQNEYDLARLSFFRAIRLNYCNAAARYHLGLLYRDGFDGFAEAALDEFKIYVRLDKVADARVQRVQRVLIPDLEETIQKRNLARPGAADSDRQKGAQLVGEAEKALKAKNYKVAYRRYEEALKADPLSPEAASGLAGVLPKVDRTPEGSKKQLEMLKLAAQLQPRTIARWLTAADYAYRLNFPAAALELYSHALALDPGKLDALDGMIRCLNKVGGHKAIAQAYQAYRREVSSRSK